MSSNSKLLLILMVLSLFLLPVFTLKVDASSEDTAALAITQAEETVASAYEAVLEAKKARANVSELLNQLNNASKYLAEARMLRDLEDFGGAVDSADLSSEIGEEVRSSAGELKIRAYESWVVGLLLRIVGSVIGVIAVVFGTFIAWRIFERRYFRQA